MILRDCDTCESRTVKKRRQLAKTDGGRPVIRTEYICTKCGTIEIHDQEFVTNGLPDRT